MRTTVCVFILALTLSSFTLAQSSYSIERKISVSGDGPWDNLCLDESSDRLFVSHASSMQVIDIKKGIVIATIPNLNGIHSIALVPSLNKGFISVGNDNVVVVFDMLTMTKTGVININGQNPDALVFDTYSQKLFCFNNRSSNASVIDVLSNAVVGEISLEGKARGAVSDNRGYLYVNIEDKADICVINTTTKSVEKTWSVAPGEMPGGLAIDPFNNRLFSACANGLMIIVDARNGKIISKLEIPQRSDGLSFDAVDGRLYCASADGFLSIIDASDAMHFKVIESLRTQRGTRTVAASSKSHHVYLPAAEFLPMETPTPEKPRPRPVIKPESFVILDIKATK